MTDLARSQGTPRARSIAYWLITVSVAAELAVGGVWDILRIEYVREVFKRLEYPEYFLTILGVPKVFGAIVLLAPRLPRLKEWAYAGAMFTYVGAVASHVAVGDRMVALVVPTGFAVLTAASWALRPPPRRDLSPNQSGFA